MPETKNVLELMSEMLQEQDNYSNSCANNLGEKATPPPLEIEQDSMKENEVAESNRYQLHNSSSNSNLRKNSNTNTNGNTNSIKNTNSGRNETVRYSDRYGDRYADRNGEKVRRG